MADYPLTAIPNELSVYCARSDEIIEVAARLLDVDGVRDLHRNAIWSCTRANV